MRITAKEALKSDIFNKVRVPHFEKAVSVKMEHEVFQSGSMDYEKGTFPKFQTKDFKSFLYKEI